MKVWDGWIGRYANPQCIQDSCSSQREEVLYASSFLSARSCATPRADELCIVVQHVKIRDPKAFHVIANIARSVYGIAIRRLCWSKP